MDFQVIFRFVLPLLGGALILATLADVFLTVLYARIGSGIFSDGLACLMWRLFALLVKPFHRGRDVVLSFCGPMILVTLVGCWVLGLVLGSALIIYPGLGRSIRSPSGPTNTDFITAVYIAGDCLTTVGSSDYAPQSRFLRLFQPLSAFIGISVITLTLTYFLEIYNALQRRNSFALKLHLLSAETGDAAELIAGVGPDGKFDTGYTHLAQMADDLTALRESHHFYPALFYFRFRDPHYALSRMALVMLDSVCLIKSAMDDERFAWLKKSAAVEQMWRGSMQLLTLLAQEFLPRGLPESPEEPDQPTLDAWHRRYHAGLRRLSEAGIQTLSDEPSGAQVYVSLRLRWDRYIKAFSEHMLHDLQNIDRAMYAPAATESPERRDGFQKRLRAVG